MSKTNLIVALPPEASPLVRHFKLRQPAHRGPFRIYESDQIRLVISGVGKAKSGAAVSYLHANIKDTRHQTWLNIGIAGHQSLPIGTGVLAHKIVDSTTGRSWYPQIVFNPSCKTDVLATVDRPEKKYPRPFAYDMEAAGFYDIASRFSTSELVHCYKIVSDNQTSLLHQVTPDLVEKLMTRHLGVIESIICQLSKLSAELETIKADPPGFNALVDRFHFTVTEQHQLRKMLRRLKILGVKIPKNKKHLSAKAVLLDMADALGRACLRY